MKNLLVHPGSVIPDTSDNWPKNVLTYDNVNKNIGYKNSDNLWPNYIKNTGMQKSLAFQTNGILFTTNMDACKDNRPGKAVTITNLQLNNPTTVDTWWFYSTNWQSGSGKYLCNHRYELEAFPGNKWYYKILDKVSDGGYVWLIGPFTKKPGEEGISHENRSLYLFSRSQKSAPPADILTVYVSEYQHALSVTTSAINYFDIANGLRYRKAWNDFGS